jgi:hypothetical protein
MPLTFPSHAAAVVPLKLWRRRWFDGVALVIGSAAPDIPYSVEPYAFVHSHTWAGLVSFCLPATILLTYLTRRAAPAVVANLPWRGLDDYAVLARHRHAWYVTVVSAYLGALTHRLWDMFTHASIDAGAIRFEFLNEEAAFGHPWWQVFHHGSTLVGGVAVALAAVHIGRTRWLLDGGPEPVRPEPSRRVFWTVAAVVWVPASPCSRSSTGPPSRRRSSSG